jgi:hypothetical protein
VEEPATSRAHDRLFTDGFRSNAGKSVFFVGFPLNILYLAASPCRVKVFELE